MDEERLARLEVKIDRLLTALDHFAPLLDRIMQGGGIVGRMAARTVANPFGKGAPK